MPDTILKYFENPYLYQDEAKILEVRDLEPQSAATPASSVPGHSGPQAESFVQKIIILDSSIFYPQGGGQPYDQGTISKPTQTATGQNIIFKVEQVRYQDGQVLHIGHFINPDGSPAAVNSNTSIQLGEIVKCQVDQPRRILHSRLHSAGHLIDYALENLGYNFEPTKGYHYSEGAYDEYKGEIRSEPGVNPDVQRAALAQKIETEVNRMIQIGAPITMKIMSEQELRKICKHFPNTNTHGKPLRGAILHLPKNEGGDRGIPCGGTHVANIKEISHMTIPKIKCKSGQVRISYRVD